MILGFIGGTGPEGKGLAYRFALAGHEVIIGSRSAERGADAAREVAERAPNATVRGAPNVDAAREATIVLITLPFEGQADTLPALRDALAGKIVVSAAVPLSFESGRLVMPAVPEGSAAEQAQALLPRARVVGAFQNLGASKLWKSDAALDQDVIVTSEDGEAKRAVMSLAGEIRGVRAVDGGPLAASHFVEGITALLIGVNRSYKKTTGVRIVGLE
ncbi:MAG: NADPH-dependent F420 reductase [Dehalococcoidia bacterium]